MEEEAKVADIRESSVLVSPEEFAEDLELRLGRANGNIYVRKPGVSGIHDGQVMVRLKKKRFIVIDYSIVPTSEDIAAAGTAAFPNTFIPPGAGKQKCSNVKCTKVGVPVILFDSEPTAPKSLYQRSGLCFECQRNLNEKRRTARKPKNPSNPKRIKLSDEVVELTADSIVIQGPVEGTRNSSDGYSYPEIGRDIEANIRGAADNVAGLIAFTGDQTPTPGKIDEVANLHSRVYGDLTRALYLLNQWKHSWDSSIGISETPLLSDKNIADAVAAAAQMVNQENQESEAAAQNMVFLAAESKDDDHGEDNGGTPKIEV